MNFDVPQYVDVEDKIAFQLTAKQLGWFGLGGVLMFFAWNYASREFFFVWAFFIVIAALAFAFLKPHGISLSAFITYGFLFLIRPKQYIWQRNSTIGAKDVQLKVLKKKELPQKQLKDVESLANVLDSKY